MQVGDVVNAELRRDRCRSRCTVVAIYGTKDPLGAYTISIAGVRRERRRPTSTTSVLVTNAPGVSMSQARRGDRRCAEGLPDGTLRTKAEFKGSVANQIDKILNLVYVLLAMALVIALFGIANTLALSVFERTREFGLLRAVGMSRSQVRSTVRWESVLIALLGTTLGTAIGLGFGWALVQALHDKGINAACRSRSVSSRDRRVRGGGCRGRGGVARPPGGPARRAGGDRRLNERVFVEGPAPAPGPLRHASAGIGTV